MKSLLNFLPATILGLLLFSCGNEEETTNKKFVSISSFIGSQVAGVDSSLYSIRKYTYIDSTRIDTEYIHRDNFKQAAADFLNIPDITRGKLADEYEESTQFDETLNRVMIIYTPKDPEKQQIQREEIVIKPDGSGDKVTSIFVHFVNESRDSVVEKKMIWRVDESFQVVTTRQLPQQPEKTTTYKVAWNENE